MITLRKGLTRMDPEGMLDLYNRLARVTGAAPVHTALPTVYDELRRIAAARLAALPPGQTLETTEIVHELLARGFADSTSWESRGHFFGAAAIAVRNLLVEHARRRQAEQRARAEVARMTPANAEGLADDDIGLLALVSALERLRHMDERKHNVVSLRFFTGLSIEETARMLEVSTATVERDWAFARAWLQLEVSRSVEGRA